MPFPVTGADPFTHSSGSARIRSYVWHRRQAGKQGSVTLSAKDNRSPKARSSMAKFLMQGPDPRNVFYKYRARARVIWWRILHAIALKLPCRRRPFGPRIGGCTSPVLSCAQQRACAISVLTGADALYAGVVQFKPSRRSNFPRRLKPSSPAGRDPASLKIFHGFALEPQTMDIVPYLGMFSPESEDAYVS